MPRLGILFWHYTEVEVCLNRLELLRRQNPGVPIWGLYGGPVGQAAEFEARLGPTLDDFYAFPEERPARWKWEQGDAVLLRWFADRGRHLDFDTVVIAQWDMVAFAPLQRLLRELPRDHVFLPSLRSVKDVERWWDRVDEAHPANRAEYVAFVRQLREERGYDHEPMCCEFYLAAFPRSFLSRWLDACLPQHGWLEYRIPMYAQLLGCPLWCGPEFRRPFVYEYGHVVTPLARRWGRTLTAGKTPISRITLAAHLMWPWGDRLFHPFRDRVPLGRMAVLQWCLAGQRP